MLGLLAASPVLRIIWILPWSSLILHFSFARSGAPMPDARVSGSLSSNSLRALTERWECPRLSRILAVVGRGSLFTMVQNCLSLD
jgi:hypothetical protein